MSVILTMVHTVVTVILAIPVLVPGLVLRVVRYDSSVGVGYNKVGMIKYYTRYINARHVCG